MRRNHDLAMLLLYVTWAMSNAMATGAAVDAVLRYRVHPFSAITWLAVLHQVPINWAWSLALWWRADSDRAQIELQAAGAALGWLSATHGGIVAGMLWARAWWCPAALYSGYALTMLAGAVGHTMVVCAVPH